MTRLLTILSCLALGACNHPSMWMPPQYVDVVILPAVSPPTYQAPTRRICHDKWGQEITASDFRNRGSQWSYGDHCYDIGLDPRPRSRGRRSVR